jgi:hypothetical protein
MMGAFLAGRGDKCHFRDENSKKRAKGAVFNALLALKKGR